MKHRNVYEHLIQRIRSGEYAPGAQLPTEVNLGKEFQVSRPTIARAMRDLQTEGLVERRAGDGTYVRLRNDDRSELSIGLLVPELGYGDIFDPICASLARSAQRAQAGVIWGNLGKPDGTSSRGRLDVSVDDAITAAGRLISQKVEGVFFAPLTRGKDDQTVNEQIVSRLREAEIQVVLLDRDVSPFPDRSELDLVSVDHSRGQYMATQVLVRSGCQRIAYLRWPGVSDSIRRRIAAFHACVRDHGHGVSAIEVEGDPHDRSLVEELLQQHKVDAIACENDLIATQLLQSLERLGVDTPGEVSVVGFNNVAMSRYLRIPLTTITQPCEQIGEVAVEVMKRRIAAPDAPTCSYVLPPTLKIRKSTRTRT